jgi:hypothetical protein
MMKMLALSFLMIFSSRVFARQYIQCNSTDSYSSDVMVVNLQTANGGTLFVSSGMQNPEDERTLVNIAFEKEEAGNHIFSIVHHNFTGFVAVPSEIIGKTSSAFNVDLNFNGYFNRFSCFARIYND